jgi:hypothetical protein
MASVVFSEWRILRFSSGSERLTPLLATFAEGSSTALTPQTSMLSLKLWVQTGRPKTQVSKTPWFWLLINRAISNQGVRSRSALMKWKSSMEESYIMTATSTLLGTLKVSRLCTKNLNILMLKPVLSLWSTFGTNPMATNVSTNGVSLLAKLKDSL